MHSILQVVDAFYAALQIRCAAHNSRIAGFTEYKKQYHKKTRLFLSLCIIIFTNYGLCFLIVCVLFPANADGVVAIMRPAK